MSGASFPGWALREAFERIVPDEFFADLRHAQTVHAESQIHRRAKQNIYDCFRGFARDGSIVVVGSGVGNNCNGVASPIPQQLWHELDGFLENISAVGKRPDDNPDVLLPETAFVGINVFPVLRAPVAIAVDLLSSELLSTVVDRFVWEDPEALKIWDDGLKRSGKLPADALQISSDKAVLVALHVGRKSMLREIKRIELAKKLGFDDAEASDTLGLYINVIADRLAALGELIATAGIGLIGLGDVSGERVSINPVEIEAGRLLLCILTGDLYRSAESNAVIRDVRVVEPSAEMEVVTSTENLSDESTADDDGALVGDEGRIGAPPSRHGYKWREALEIVIGRALRHEGKPISNYTQLCDALSAAMVDELGMDGGLYKISDTVRRKTKVHWPWLRSAAGGED